MDDYVEVNFVNYDIITYVDMSKTIVKDDVNYSLIQNNLEFTLGKFLKEVNQIEFIVNYDDIYEFCNYSIDELKRQYKIDATRQDIYYNNLKITKTDIFLDYLTFKFTTNLNKVLMFITQTIYAYIIKYIHFALPSDIFIGEITNKLCKMRIDIIVNKDNIQIKSKKKLRFFKTLVNDETVLEFEILFDLDIDSDNVLVQLTR